MSLVVLSLIAAFHRSQSGGSLAGVGDVFSQLLVEDRWRKGGYEPIRTAHKEV
uniref:Uncharacterized protein n=1 Tax=Parascaris equorum TaxID=6256 RepID=A0A914RCJ9_PAREQ